MSPRPTIFISAVSRELRTARQLVANTLSFLGYEPVWQDIFGTEQGDLREVLRRQIDSCKGVVQLVGHSYGAEPLTPDPEFGRVSYTQYEALYAKKQGKKIWYLLLDQTFPDDSDKTEPEELRNLQSAYRQRVAADVHLFHPLTSREALENSVLKLRDDLTHLRRGVKQWAAAVAALLLISVGLGIWMLQREERSANELAQTTGALKAMQQDMLKLRQGVFEFADAQAKAREADPDQNPAEIESRTYTELGKRLGVDPSVLQKQLPAVAQQLRDSKTASKYDRANAAFVNKDFVAAEELALGAAAEDKKTADTVKALLLASNAARARIEFSKSLVHSRAAEKLTDRSSDQVLWAQVQMAIARALADLGQPREAEPILREVIAARTGSLGPNKADTLISRQDLASALFREGKFAEAETEARAVLELRKQSLPPGHPETLMSRNLLAAILSAEGKHGQAESEFRQILDERQKTLGPDNPETLRTRGDLGLVLVQEGKLAEAETEDRALVELYAKRGESERPESLRARAQLAFVLVREGKAPEGEKEARGAGEVLTRVLGPEHPETLFSRYVLAMALNREGKLPEAEREARAVLELRRKVIGPEHPQTLTTMNGLAEVLRKEQRFEEAESLTRETIALRTKVLGPEHPETIMSRNNLALTLNQEHKFAEAEQEGRQVLALREKVLGPTHNETVASRRLLANILRAEGKQAEAASLRAVAAAPVSDGSE